MTQAPCVLRDCVTDQEISSTQFCCCLRSSWNFCRVVGTRQKPVEPGSSNTNTELTVFILILSASPPWTWRSPWSSMSPRWSRTAGPGWRCCWWTERRWDAAGPVPDSVVVLHCSDSVNSVNQFWTGCVVISFCRERSDLELVQHLGYFWWNKH